MIRWLRRRWHGRLACMAKACPHQRLGVSAWCRRHTDEILEDRKSPEVLAALNGGSTEGEPNA